MTVAERSSTTFWPTFFTSVNVFSVTLNKQFLSKYFSQYKGNPNVSRQRQFLPLTQVRRGECKSASTVQFLVL